MQRYATFFVKKNGKNDKAGKGDIDELLNDEDLSDSVSSVSGCSESVSLSSIDLDADDLGVGNSNAEIKA